jgi:hypothetical protein
MLVAISVILEGRIGKMPAEIAARKIVFCC